MQNTILFVMEHKISSKQNPKIKQLQKWYKTKERKKDKIILVEGIKEVNMALEAGFEVLESYIVPEIIEHKNQEILYKLPENKIFSVSKQVYETIAYRESSEGIIVVFKEKKIELSDAFKWILILENIEKPGNLGAILRTANAMGIDAIFITGNSVDVFNPNTIRSSLGAVFFTPVFVLNNTEAEQWLIKQGFNIYVTSSKYAYELPKLKFSKRKAIVFGSESLGVTDFWEKNTYEKVKIPMVGKPTSLNVSVAAAIVCYEIFRQENYA